MSRILFSVALAVGLAVSAQAQTCDELKAKINTYYDNIKTACGDNKGGCPSTSECIQAVKNLGGWDNVANIYKDIGKCSDYITQTELVDFVAYRALECGALSELLWHISDDTLRCLRGAIPIWQACPRDCTHDTDSGDNQQQNRLRRQSSIIELFSVPKCANEYISEFGTKCFEKPSCSAFFKGLSADQVTRLNDDLRHCLSANDQGCDAERCNPLFQICREDSACAAILDRVHGANNQDVPNTPDDFLNNKYFNLAMCRAGACGEHEDMCWATKCKSEAFDCFNDATCKPIAAKAMSDGMLWLTTAEQNNAKYKTFTQCFEKSCPNTEMCILSNCPAEVDACGNDATCKKIVQSLNEGDNDKGPSADDFTNDNFFDLFACAGKNKCMDDTDACWAYECGTEAQACLDDGTCFKIAKKALEQGGDSLTDEDEKDPFFGPYGKCLESKCQQGGSGSGGGDDCMQTKCQAPLNDCSKDSTCAGILHDINSRNGGPTIDELANQKLFAVVKCSGVNCHNEGNCWVQKCAAESQTCYLDTACRNEAKRASQNFGPGFNSTNAKYNDMQDCLNKECSQQNGGGNQTNSGGNDGGRARRANLRRSVQSMVSHYHAQESQVRMKGSEFLRIRRDDHENNQDNFDQENAGIYALFHVANECGVLGSVNLNSMPDEFKCVGTIFQIGLQNIDDVCLQDCEEDKDGGDGPPACIATCAAFMGPGEPTCEEIGKCDTSSCDAATKSQIEMYVKGGCVDGDDKNDGGDGGDGPPECVKSCAAFQGPGEPSCDEMGKCDTSSCDAKTKSEIEMYIQGGCKDGDDGGDGGDGGDGPPPCVASCAAFQGPGEPACDEIGKCDLSSCDANTKAQIQLYVNGGCRESGDDDDNDDEGPPECIKDCQAIQKPNPTCEEIGSCDTSKCDDNTKAQLKMYVDGGCRDSDDGKGSVLPVCGRDQSEYGVACLTSREQCRTMLRKLNDANIQKLVQNCPSEFRDGYELAEFVSMLQNHCCLENSITYTDKYVTTLTDGDVSVTLPGGGPRRDCMTTKCSAEYSSCLLVSECATVLTSDGNPRDVTGTGKKELVALAKCLVDSDCFGRATECPKDLPTLSPIDEDLSSSTTTESIADSSSTTLFATKAIVAAATIFVLLF